MLYSNHILYRIITIENKVIETQHEHEISERGIWYRGIGDKKLIFTPWNSILQLIYKEHDTTN